MVCVCFGGGVSDSFLMLCGKAVCGLTYSCSHTVALQEGLGVLMADNYFNF